MAEETITEAIAAASPIDKGDNADTPDDTDAEITRLAGLSITQYERERKPAAQRLGLRTSVLDKLVRVERPKDDSDRQGRALQLPEPEPWHAPVDGAALLSEIAHTIRRYVVLSDHAADAAALWTVHAHVVDASNTSPRLFLTSPEKRCGKTTMLVVLSRIVPRPVQVANISPSPLFRAIEIARPTMMLDEADSFATSNDDLRGIINAGHQRDGAVIRAVGDDHEPRLFSVWGAMAIAGIGSMPATIEDRSIIIRLRRRRPEEDLQRFRLDRTPDLDRLASMATRWAADIMDALSDADPDVPGELHDRAADNWRALLAIADAVGGDWSQRARSAALALSNSDEGEDQSIGVKLLGDIRAVFVDQIDERISSPDLAAALHAMEDRPWPEYGRARKPISVHQIARLLKPFGIVPRKLRIGEGSVRGYPITSFNDAFARYLPSQVGTSEQTAVPCEFSAFFRSEHSSFCSDLELGCNPQGTAVCSDVPTWNGESSDSRAVEVDAPAPGGVDGDDDIEREAIMNEGEFDASRPTAKSTWDI